MSKRLKPVKTKKQKVDISEEEKKLLEKFKDMEQGPEISNDEASVLDILTKRKTLDQITREFNIILKPLNRTLFTTKEILELLKSLEKKELIKKIEAPIGEVWVSVEFFREKLRGTEKL